MKPLSFFKLFLEERVTSLLSTCHCPQCCLPHSCSCRSPRPPRGSRTSRALSRVHPPPPWRTRAWCSALAACLPCTTWHVARESQTPHTRAGLRDLPQMGTQWGVFVGGQLTQYLFFVPYFPDQLSLVQLWALLVRLKSGSREEIEENVIDQLDLLTEHGDVDAGVGGMTHPVGGGAQIVPAHGQAQPGQRQTWAIASNLINVQCIICINAKHIP